MIYGTSPLKNEVPGRYTYADYKEWELAEGERYELIGGKAYAMSAPNARHQEISAILTAEFVNFFRDKPCKVYPAPYDVRLFYESDESDDTVVQPDLSVVCDEQKRGAEGCHGPPDFTAEILSPSNTVIEMMQKNELYRQAGVREYWIIDSEKKMIQAWNFEAAEHGRNSRIFKETDTAASFIFSGLEINLERLFAE